MAATPEIVAGRTIVPQSGPQSAFLSTSADIAIYGGSAGGGKTWGLLMEPLRHVSNQHFGAVFLRRTTPQITNEGAIWDESGALYPQIGAQPNQSTLTWSFPSGASISMSHLEHEKTVLNWQGSQIPLLLFDELTHFTAAQFWYMLSRNRSMCGVRPYVRATCNPDADSWVAELIAWWIDPATGYAIPERSGVVRWFVRVGDRLQWGDTPADLAHFTAPDEDGVDQPIPPKSLTFIAAKLTDNRALMARDPGYMANLMSLPLVERERLLGGNWKIRATEGTVFRRAWFAGKIVTPDQLPTGYRTTARAWDFAATAPAPGKRPDWTAGVRMFRHGSDFYIDHVERLQTTPAKVRSTVKSYAETDPIGTIIRIPQDPGQAGVDQAESYIAALAGWTVHAVKPTGEKLVRATPFATQVEHGNVYFAEGAWNDAFFDELCAFPLGLNDDQVDAAADAFSELAGPAIVPFQSDSAGRREILSVTERDSGAGFRDIDAIEEGTGFGSLPSLSRGFDR